MKFVEIEGGRWINLDKVEDIIIKNNEIIASKLLNAGKYKKYQVEFYFNIDNYVVKEFDTYEEAKTFIEDILRR